ncbi:hypothetical protein HOY82DRAFT_604986 [Tuber indicum]|nr:hypothetical protein HOY82DRAFT_604986 [Tuber indicum]
MRRTTPACREYFRKWPVVFGSPTLEGLEIVVSLWEEANLGVRASAEFPSLEALPHTVELDTTGLMFSKRIVEMAILYLDWRTPIREGGGSVEEVMNKIGQRVFVDGYHILIDAVGVFLHVNILKGLKNPYEGTMVKQYAQAPGVETDYAAQTIVEEVVIEYRRFLEKFVIPLAEEFPKREGAGLWQRYFDKSRAVHPIHTVNAITLVLKLNRLILSRITSSSTVVVDYDRLNLGLELKLRAKKLKCGGTLTGEITGGSSVKRRLTLSKSTSPHQVH